MAKYASFRNRRRIESFCNLLKRELPDVRAGVEFGTRAGESTELLLELNPNVDLITVGSWLKVHGRKETHSQGQKDLDRETAIDRLDRFRDRLSIWQMDAMAAAFLLEGRNLDFAYVDVSYEKAWLARHLPVITQCVGSGGIVAGSGWHRLVVRRAVGEQFENVEGSHSLWWSKVLPS